MTAFVGATLFQIGAVLVVIEATNENQAGCFGWELERALSEKKSSGYRPKREACTHHHHNRKSFVSNDADDRSTPPNGARRWEWWPTWNELRNHYFHELGFIVRSPVKSVLSFGLFREEDSSDPKQCTRTNGSFLGLIYPVCRRHYFLYLCDPRPARGLRSPPTRCALGCLLAHLPRRWRYFHYLGNSLPPGSPAKLVHAPATSHRLARRCLESHWRCGLDIIGVVGILLEKLVWVSE